MGWADLPEPIAIDDLEAFERGVRDGLPAWLGPRRVGAHVHVVRVGKVVDMAFSRGEQVLSALIEGEGGGRILVRVGHRAVSPGAIDATAQALGASPRFVSGEVSRQRGGLVMEPLAFLSDSAPRGAASLGARLVVPDLERPNAQASLPPSESAMTPMTRGDSDPLDEVLSELRSFIERGTSRGIGALGPSETLARRLGDVGLPRVSEAVTRAARPEGLLDLIIIERALELAR